MGSCPTLCYRNAKIENDYPVQINSIENPEYNTYLKQPNYSLLILLQTRIKKFLKKKNFHNDKFSQKYLPSQKINLITSSNSKPIDTYVKKESTAKFNMNNLRAQSTDKEENYYKKYTQNYTNKIDLIEEQRLSFPKIILNKKVSMFQEDLFLKQNIDNNNEDPRKGPFNGKRKKYPILIQDDFSYEGEWKNGKRDGIGILIKKDMAKYIGEFIEDKANGYGILLSQNGDEFEYKGYWKDSKAHGYGIYNKKEVISYKGIWEYDKPHKFGIEKWPQSEYIGEYNNGNKEGYGILNIRNAIYEGQMKDGNIDGIGCFIFKDKRKYIGEFVNNKMEGYGILTFPDGKVFIGSFKDDLEDGFGVFYTSKKIYVGIWQNMLLEGEVIVIEGDKRKKQLWDQGKFYKNLSQNYEIFFEKFVDEIIQQKKLFE